MEVTKLILKDGALIGENGVLGVETPEVLSLFNHSEPQHTSSGHVEQTVLLCLTSTGEPFRGDGPVSTEVAAGERGVGH